MKPKMVTEVLETLSFYDFEGSLDATIQRLQALQETYKGKDVKLDVRQQQHSKDYEYVVVWTRPENEEEIKKCEEEEAKFKAYRRTQYESLKKEFDKQE